MTARDAITVELDQDILSPDESALDGSAPGAGREKLEAFLYEHLSLAARARMRMDSARSWNYDYHLDYRGREIALEAASRCYRALLDMGGEIEPLLAQMFITEGLTP